MIEPTVGRIVWLYDAHGVNYNSSKRGRGGTQTPPDQPFAARIVYVWSPVLVNLAYEDHAGQTLFLAKVQLLQDDDKPPLPRTEPYCAWMPYQKGQAAKTEALENKIK